MATFKICCCCGTQTGLRKRVCQQCKSPAIFREPTEIEQRSHAESEYRARQLLAELIGSKDAGEQHAAP
jgi:predicted amidophosphoribosyltransferase